MMSPATIEIIGMVAAVLTTACWVPQAVRTIRTKETRGISLWAQILLVCGIALWLVYGLLIMSWPLIFANTVTFGLVAIILTLKLRYG
ncbi:MAG: SemiSWEET transporter [Bosea sp. (in: a-proteobacteria)]